MDGTGKPRIGGPVMEEKGESLLQKSTQKWLHLGTHYSSQSKFSKFSKIVSDPPLTYVLCTVKITLFYFQGGTIATAEASYIGIPGAASDLFSGEFLSATTGASADGSVLCKDYQG